MRARSCRFTHLFGSADVGLAARWLPDCFSLNRPAFPSPQKPEPLGDFGHYFFLPARRRLVFRKQVSSQLRVFLRIFVWQKYDFTERTMLNRAGLYVYCHLGLLTFGEALSPRFDKACHADTPCLDAGFAFAAVCVSCRSTLNDNAGPICAQSRAKR